MVLQILGLFLPLYSRAFERLTVLEMCFVAYENNRANTRNIQGDQRIRVYKCTHILFFKTITNRECKGNVRTNVIKGYRIKGFKSGGGRNKSKTIKKRNRNASDKICTPPPPYVKLLVFKIPILDPFMTFACALPLTSSFLNIDGDVFCRIWK